MKDMKVGELRSTTIGVVKCVEDEIGVYPCHDCCFYDGGCSATMFGCGHCSRNYRKDGFDVHFKLEKGGEQ